MSFSIGLKNNMRLVINLKIILVVLLLSFGFIRGTKRNSIGKNYQTSPINKRNINGNHKYNNNERQYQIGKDISSLNQNMYRQKKINAESDNSMSFENRGNVNENYKYNSNERQNQFRKDISSLNQNMYGHNKIKAENDNNMNFENNKNDEEQKNREYIHKRIESKIKNRLQTTTGWQVRLSYWFNKIYEIANIIHPLELLKVIL
ncbi:myb-like protein D [Leptopilina boulardi]|uniref:myb-like protein D n=1 Tax=Leptopilina boulardi TaxID=63433 RepID=UPI0021F56CB6|nr:myb-like protein D [Leptopilina boulardi]